MEQTTVPVNSIENLPPDSKITLDVSNGNVTMSVPPRGFKGKALFTILIISVWMFTILVWSVLLLMMKPIYVLYSIPFWAIGFVTMFKSISMLTLEQSITITGDSLVFRMKRGMKADERKFKINDVVVNLVEGSFYSYTGLNRRGQYPAIVSNNEAFGFGERLSRSEKQWVVSTLNKYLNSK